MDVLGEIINRWGLPTGFAVWLMWVVTRDLREIRNAVYKQSVVNAVILKTLDVPEAAAIAAGPLPAAPPEKGA